MKLGYNEHSVITNSVVNAHSVITNRFLGQIGYYSTQINPVITNKNGRSRAVRYNRVWPYINPKLKHSRSNCGSRAAEKHFFSEFIQVTNYLHKNSFNFNIFKELYSSTQNFQCFGKFFFAKFTWNFYFFTDHGKGYPQMTSHLRWDVLFVRNYEYCFFFANYARLNIL